MPKKPLKKITTKAKSRSAVKPSRSNPGPKVVSSRSRVESAAVRSLDSGIHTMDLAHAPDSVRPRVGDGGFRPETIGEGRYVYGIIAGRDALTFGKMGLGGNSEMVYTVNQGDISAVV